MTTGASHHRRVPAAPTQGFTLLEILIVLVIISIAAGMVQWGAASRSELAALRQEAEDAGALLNFASEYGLAHQQTLGLLVDESGYELMAYDEQDKSWHSLDTANDKETVGSDVRLFVDNPAPLPDLPIAAGMKEPAVLVDTDGTLSPASLVFQWRDAPALQVRLTVETDGSLHINSGGAPHAGS